MIKKMIIYSAIFLLLLFTACAEKKQSWYRDYRDSSGICSQIFTESDLSEYKYQIGTCPEINKALHECQYYVNFQNREMRCYLYYYSQAALEDVSKEAMEEACKALMAASVHE